MVTVRIMSKGEEPLLLIPTMNITLELRLVSEAKMADCTMAPTMPSPIPDHSVGIRTPLYLHSTMILTLPTNFT